MVLWAAAQTGPGDWRMDPVALVLAGLAAGCYLAAVRRLRRAGRRWPVRRTVAFLGPGTGSLLGVSMGWPAAYASVAFSVYAVQIAALLLIVPFLLALGRPLELALTALPPARALRLRHLLAGPVLRLVTTPMAGPLLLAVVPFGIFFTAVLPASLAHPPVLFGLHAVVLAIGVVVLVPLWESPMVDVRVPYALALLIALVELLADALPGIVISSDNHVLAAAHFLTTVRPWGNSPLHDQQLGGDLLMGLGEVLDLPFLALLMLQWIRSDARDAIAADGDAGPSAGPVSSPDGWERPWWETDASVFGDRAAQYHNRPPGD